MRDAEMLKWALRTKRRLRLDVAYQDYKKRRALQDIRLHYLRHRCQLCGRN